MRLLCPKSENITHFLTIKPTNPLTDRRSHLKSPNNGAFLLKISWLHLQFSSDPSLSAPVQNALPASSQYWKQYLVQAGDLNTFLR